MPELGPPLGKGDAMWRALSVARGELIAYLDSDTRRFSAHFATGMLGPLLLDPGARFVKGTFRRPFATPGGQELPADGGRVTELMARPLLSAFYPELAGFAQPLAGEVAARARALPPASRSPPGTRSRPRCCWTPTSCSAAPRGWPRWTWTCAATATSRWPSSGRWPTRCCGWWPTGCGGDGRLLDAEAARSWRAPPFASLRIAA